MGVLGFAFALLVLPTILDHQVYGEQNNLKKCDIYQGKWVYDASYPLYDSSLCHFMDTVFACQRNGRDDKLYLKYKWQPSSCNLQRFNGEEFLERFRDKRIMFVGDSLSLNQWQSLTCMLHATSPQFEYTLERVGSTSTFTFQSHNVSVMFQRNAFLVDVANKTYGEVLELDSIGKDGEAWKEFDVLIFNTWHWWNHTGRKQPWKFMQDGNHLFEDMDRLVAYKKALKTWAQWVDKNVDPTKTKVFFQSVSPSHYNSRDWGNTRGQHCAAEREPLAVPPHPRSKHAAEVIVEEVLRDMSKLVNLLNVTALSQLRKDGHPSVYGLGGHHGMDCSHWCLPGVPDTWNQLLYTELIRN